MEKLRGWMARSHLSYLSYLSYLWQLPEHSIWQPASRHLIVALR